MTVDISKLIDKRNELLYNEINSKCKIDFQPSPESAYSCYSKAEFNTFYVPLNNQNPDAFTHELLHVYLRLKKIYTGPSLNFTLSVSNKLRRVFSDRLIEHMGNSLDHIKMLPIYLEMGLKRELFVVDYHKIACTDMNIKEIKNNYKNNNNYNSKTIESFVGLFFAMKTNPNPTQDYTNTLAKLRKIDEPLYLILTGLIDAWIQFDIECPNVSDTYDKLIADFYEKLKPWMSNKIFV